MLEHFFNTWRPLQETIANCYLLKIQSNLDNSDQYDIVNSLVWEQNRDSKIITNLTKICNNIMTEIGYEKGWKLLNFMSIEASSPDFLHIETEPKNYEELKKLKSQMFDIGYSQGRDDPYLNDPTGRFIEMLTVIVRNIDIAKKSFNRGVDELQFVSYVGSLCGHKNQFLPDNLGWMRNVFKLISEKNGIIPDIQKNLLHKKQKLLTKIFYNFPLAVGFDFLLNILYRNLQIQ